MKTKVILRTLTKDRVSQCSGPDCETADQGVTMIALLIVVVLLGLLATVVLSSHHGPTPQDVAGGTTRGTTTTIPQSIGSAAQHSVVAACELDFQSVNAALGTYRVANNALPAAGTAWAISAGPGGPYLKSWPSNARYYSITWNGSTLSVIPTKGVASHGSYGTSSPATGCFAP